MRTSSETLETEYEIESCVYRSPFYKRVLDVSIIILAHIALLPIWVIIWLVIPVAIWLEDRGPVFFTDQRVGQYGRRFKAYKFRSMVVNADDGLGPKQAEENDSRITKVGKILRATALDELPQLINILIGDMSFVGPRALRENEIEINSDFGRIEHVPGYRIRTQVSPGLTGIAQVYAPRDINKKNKFRYDAVYVKKMSPWLDIKLVVLSVWVTLRGKWESRNDKIGLKLGNITLTRRRVKKEEVMVSNKPIGQILLEERVITKQQLNDGIQFQKMQGGKLGQNLIRKGYISESSLRHFLDKQLAMNGGRYQSL